MHELVFPSPTNNVPYFPALLSRSVDPKSTDWHLTAPIAIAITITVAVVRMKVLT